MARRKGWILTQGKGVDARCLDLANSDCRDWYVSKLVPLLKCGIDGWWDDEGEITGTTYFWWNQAEGTALAAVNPNSAALDDRSFLWAGTPAVRRGGVDRGYSIGLADSWRKRRATC